MGEVRAVQVPLFWAIIEGNELLLVGVTEPGNMNGSAREYIVSDTEAGLIAQLATHGITEEAYLQMKEGL